MQDGLTPDEQGRRVVLHVSDGRSTTVFDQDEVSVGRGLDCDVVVSGPSVSRRHVLLRRAGGLWSMTDQSSNGTYVDGRQVDVLSPSSTPTRLRLGSADGTSVVLWQATGGEEDPALTIPPGQVPHGSVVSGPARGDREVVIGRDLNCDVVLQDPLVSRRHARLVEQGATTTLHDLGSFNGTFVNEVRVQGSSVLRAGDRVGLGNQTFAWDGQRLTASASVQDLTMHAQSITARTADGRVLLDDVSFSLAPGSLTAVIGPSGAGKSTLLGAVTGTRPATEGHVVWQGHDLYEHYDRLRLQVGLVPQEDIQHPQLKVGQALGYSAELRLPPDTSARERRARVEAVAQQLQLGERLENRIGTQLSGGQRKRVSIAAELLTAPPLLFLDEPTSGLDPGMDLEVMRQLRSLSRDGHVVMVVTHSVLALDVCDNVLVMAPGGRVAHVGPPGGVLEHFGATSYPELFSQLEKGTVEYRQPAVGAPVSPPVSPSASDGAPSEAPQLPRRRQLATLVRRNLAIAASDRVLLAMLVVLPLALGGLSRLVPGDAGLSLLRAPEVNGVLGGGEARQRLTVLVIAAALMGSAMTIRDLVGERAIFRREYAVGLSPAAYMVSKVGVFGTITFLQGLLVTYLATVGLPAPDGGGATGLGTAELFVAIGALSATMAVLGLCVSALVRSNEQTMPALVGIVMTQLVLSGALIAIAGRRGLEQVAWLSPARWGYVASASTVDLERAAQPTDASDWLARNGAWHWGMDVGILGVQCAVVVVLGCLLVRRSATQR